MISNNATTGWKLQGASVNKRFIKEWNNSDEKWIYVMLSRVRERKGLFLESKIDKNPKKYSLNKQLLNMLSKLDDVACSIIEEKNPKKMLFDLQS